MSGANYDVPDPATGLTPREKDVIRNTWAIAKQDQEGTGYDLFIRFFTENPSYQSNFKSFAGVPLAELRGNKKVLAHALNVLSAITALVDSLDDTEVIVEMLTKLAGNHFRRGIKIEMFQNLGVTIVGLLKEKLGAAMDDQAVEAWKKTYGVIVSVIGKGLDAAAKAE